MQTTMTVKGQVTIPKAVRERAGLRPGMRVEVGNREDGKVFISPVTQNDADYQRRYQAALDRFEAASLIYDAQRDPANQWQNMTTDEVMAELREPLEPFELDPTIKLT